MAVFIINKPNPTAPEVISLAVAKDHLKVDGDDENELISSYIDAAIEHAENYTGISIKEALYEYRFSSFPSEFLFKTNPVQSIDSIVYLDENNAEQTLDASKYELVQTDRYFSTIIFEDDLPTLAASQKAVIINVSTGFEESKTPAVIKSAILLILGALYENRQDKIQKLPTASQSLLGAYRIYY